MIRLMNRPLTCPGCYSLDAYCKYENSDHIYDEFPHRAYAQTYAQAARELKSIGWVLHKDNTATCPKCVKVLKGKKP